MINFAECLRYYASWIYIDKSFIEEWCDYYQNQCRYYEN